uniref:Ribonuclease H-like domain-containing protein n=1 Tax=Tanacetum cinerariifolium TaxID=118510 RepID=A0A6L2MHV0_TANCI|nr:ribonuclease H-like domain-containing protein [Tanacetum cinerariifolium]
MRIEQYFLMTDYSLWEVILSGVGKKNELKARGTLLMALPDKHQLKFNIHKDGKTLMEAIEKRFGGNKKTKKVQKTLLKQQYENFIGSSSESLDQIHDRLTNEPVSAAASVSAVSTKIFVFALPNVDTLSNAVIYLFFASQSTSPQLDNDDLKKIDADDLEEMDLKWQISMLTVECYNCHMKGHFARECRSPKDTRRNAMTEVFKQKRNLPTMLLWPSLLQVLLLTMRYQSGDGYHVVPPPYTGTFMPPKPDLVFHNAPDINETVHTTFNVELSPTKPDNDLSHTHRPSAPIIEDWVSDSEDESETKISQNLPSFVQPTEQVKSPRPSVQHVETSIPTANPKTAIPKPTSNDTCRNRKACFVCKSLDHLIKDCDFYKKKMAQTPARNHVQRGNHQQYARMTLPNPQKHVVPTAFVIDLIV